MPEEILIKSSYDGTMQPSLFYKSPNPGRPLLVGLHTWSFDRFNTLKTSFPYAKELDFNFLSPNFRGPNLPSNPECRDACGSMAARMDIKDAIDYVKANYDIDEGNIFLLGISGGGQMALLMAGLCPEYFRAIAAVVPITNLLKWHEESASYRSHVDACTGGNVDEMMARSPITYVDEIADANLKIFHGKWDNVVPCSHSIGFYNTLIERHPDAKVYLDIFDGGHQIDFVTAMHWITTQYKKTSATEATG